MKLSLNYIYLIVGMGVVTYFPRLLPATILSQREIPDILVRFLRYVPVAVLSALFLPGVLMVENKIILSTSNPLFVATLFTFPLAYWKKSMFLTVLVGMGIIIFLNNI